VYTIFLIRIQNNVFQSYVSWRQNL